MVWQTPQVWGVGWRGQGGGAQGLEEGVGVPGCQGVGDPGISPASAPRESDKVVLHTGRMRGSSSALTRSRQHSPAGGGLQGEAPLETDRGVVVHTVGPSLKPSLAPTPQGEADKHSPTWVACRRCSRPRQSRWPPTWWPPPKSGQGRSRDRGGALGSSWGGVGVGEGADADPPIRPQTPWTSPASPSSS